MRLSSVLFGSVALAIGLGCADGASADALAPAPFAVEATIPLPNTAGRIDHMAVDPRRGRLFVAELGNGTVDVIDIAALKVLDRISGLKQPQGIGISDRADLVAVASAGDGTVRLFRGDTLAPAGVLALGDDADNVRLAERTGSLIVGYGAGALALIDPVRRAKIGEIRLRGHPESFQLDPERGLAFVNVPDAREVAVVDLSNRQVAASWRVPGALGNFPMAYDPDTREVAIVTRNPPELIVFAAESGQVKLRLPACGDADDVFFDQRRHRLYVSCGTGEIAAWKIENGNYHRIASTPTRMGARTSLFVPALDLLFVAERAGLIGGTAAILVLRPQD